MNKFTLIALIFLSSTAVHADCDSDLKTLDEAKSGEATAPQAGMPGAGPSVKQEAEVSATVGRNASSGAADALIAEAKAHKTAGREQPCLDAVKKAREALGRS